MFKALMKSKLLSLLSWVTGASRSKKKQSKAAMIGYCILLLYIVGVFFMMFDLYFSEMATAFYSVGIGWLYFTFYAMIAFAMIFVGSIFSIKSQLFEARDNEMLLSMPIPPKAILASRMFVLLLIELAFELVVAIPAMWEWSKVASLTPGIILAFILISIGILFFSFAVACFMAWVISMITSRVRNKSMMNVVLSLAFLAAYFYFYSKVQVYLTMLLQNGSIIAQKISGTAVPLYWIGNGVAEGNGLHLLFAMLILVVPFVVVYAVISKCFIRIVTTKRGFAKKEYQAKEMKVVSVRTALWKREGLRLVTASSYLLNAGLGVFMTVVAGVAMLVKKDVIQQVIAFTGFPTDVVVIFITLGICLFSSMTLFTAPSISMEGKNLWIIRSMPVSTKDILRAKLSLHNRIMVPAIIFLTVVCAFVLELDIVAVILMLVIAVVYVFFMANLGLIFNIKHPNLNWITETQAVKNNISVMLSMVVGMAVVLVPGVAYFYFVENIVMEQFLLPFAVLCIALVGYTYRWLMTKGAERFERL